MMERNRIQWIDALKGYGIILVTFAHLSPWAPIEAHIYSFHMCLFFFISGYLHNREKPFGKFAADKIKTLFVPFLIWDSLSSIVSLIMGEQFQTVLVKFLLIDGKLCWNSPIWFLLVLFITELFYAIAVKLIRSKHMPLFLAFISAGLWILFGTKAVTFKLNLVPLAMFFYALGDGSHAVFDGRKRSGLTAAAFLIMGTISVVFGAVLNDRITYTGGYFGNIYYCILAAVSGTGACWLAFQYCNVLGTSRVLRKIGKNSMIIMAVQYWFFEVYDIVSLRFFNFSIWHLESTVKAAAVAAITIIMILALVSAFKKIFRNHSRMLEIGRYFGIR